MAQLGVRLSEAKVNLNSVSLFLSGPRLDFDPDIVAALDDDFDFDDPENLLEDDFILQASKPAGGEGMDMLYVWGLPSVSVCVWGGVNHAPNHGGRQFHSQDICISVKNRFEHTVSVSGAETPESWWLVAFPTVPGQSSTTSSPIPWSLPEVALGFV